MLQRERFEIERQYIELDDAILHGAGSVRILDAARRLAGPLLVHLTHEEQHQRQIAFPALDDPQVVRERNMAELLQIETGLRQAEVYAALRLRSFCKGWILEQKMWNSIFQPSIAVESDSARL